MLTTAVVIFAAVSSAYGASPVLRTLHSFAGEPGDGATPYGSLVLGAGNVLYGVTYSGGAGPCAGSFSGCGMAFSLAPPTNPWRRLDRNSASYFYRRKRRSLPDWRPGNG
jgi:hypothetical protein